MGRRDKRKRRKEGLKKVSSERDEPGINNLVSLVGAEEGRADEQCLRTTDRILPSCEATWGRKEGPPEGFTWPTFCFLSGSQGIKG